MASWTELRLQNPGYRRYILAGLTRDWLCTQLVPYLNHVIGEVHADLIDPLAPHPGHTKPVCHGSANKYKEVKTCKQRSCGDSVKFLDSLHTSGKVSHGWRNSNIELWEAQPWAVGLLFMNPGQDPATNTDPTHSDISGIINLMEHCSRFGVDPAVVTEIRNRRNQLIHHSPNFEVTEAKLLTDPDVTPHVTGDVSGYLDEMKKMKCAVTFNDEVKVFQDMLNDANETQRKMLVDQISRHEDLKEELLKQTTSITKNKADIAQDKADIALHDEQITQHAGRITDLEQQVTEMRTTSPAVPVALRADFNSQTLQEEILQCYSRPEYEHLNPLVDSATLGHFIESVFVEMSVEERSTQPVHDVTVINPKGNPVSCVNDMVPSPGGNTVVLLTGFVGSGKSTLCLHWVHEWAVQKRGPNEDKSPIHQYNIVFLLRANALEDDVYQSIANLIFTKDCQTSADDIKAAVASNNSILLLFDGYDEASAEQKKMIDEVANHTILPKASVIISSRPNFFNGKKSKWYNNLGFTQEQQLRFIDKFKASLVLEEQIHIDNFKANYLANPNAESLLNSPMMAMTTCTMAASGEEVKLDSRIQNYKQITDFIERRACYKSQGHITSEKIKDAMGVFRHATYNRILQNNAYHFSQDDIVNYISQETFDSIIIHLGYLSVTRYIYRCQPVTAYSFVHKSWAEFIAAQHVMSLNAEDRRTAVQQLFQSGPVNLEILRFVLGLCCMDQPEHLVGLITAITDVVVNDEHFLSDSEGLQQETETIKAGRYDISLGSIYLILLLTDVDPLKLPPAAARALSLVCAAIRRAELREDAISSTVQGGIDVSSKDRESAAALYPSMLLSAHSAQGSLHTVRHVEVWYALNSPYSAVTRLPATLALCAPNMTGLTQFKVDDLTSATELGELCDGLVASGLRCLTHIQLQGTSDMSEVAGCDLGPVARVIRTAAQLMELRLVYIHCGEEDQLHVLCAAVGEAAPQLTHLKLKYCSVSSQQYRAVLVPALHRRRTAGRARLQRVTLRDRMDRGSRGWRCCCCFMSYPERILWAGLKWEADSVKVILYKDW